ncbi:hypothetical protein CHARACLAT_012405 [Characodon lateralis]|uniref:Telethonin n=1 Tax=Characodon lateralis TaxID=208331 RepID=A0ABU7D8Y0_9TELE|nr:hypothetical protein [Characodon lateralis]
MHCVSRGGSYLVNSYCDLQEDNLWKKESYSSCWINVVLETRPQYRMTLSETDSVRRESYKQQQVAHLMVERSPRQTLKLGTERGATTEYQLPFFNKCKEPQRFTRTEEPVIVGKGKLEANREEGPTKTQDLCKPVRENFRASSLMSSPREVSHRVQRRV